jgi:hypothetical protein
MKLTRISVRNFKGKTGSLDLTTANFLIGPNWAGKTTWLDAIRLVLIGHLPELGKQNSATFGLSSGRDMEVAAETDTGLRISRRWFTKGDSVKTEEALPPELFEKEDEVLTVMLNAETYFSLTERNRVAYISSNVPAGESKWTAESATAAACEAAGIPARGDQELVKSIWKAVEDKRLEVKAPLSLQEYVEASVEGASSYERSSAAYAKTMEKTVQGLSGLRASDAPQDNIDLLDRKRLETGVEIDRLQDEKTKATLAAWTAKENQTRRNRLQAALASKPNLESIIQSLELSIDAKEHEIQGIPSVSQEDIDRLVLEDRTAYASLADLGSQFREAQVSLSRAQGELSGVEAKATCPFCGASGEGWKALKTAELTTTISGLKERITVLSDRQGAVKANLLNITTKKTAALLAQQRQKSAEAEKAQLVTHLSEARNATAQIASVEKELAEIPAGDGTAEAEVVRLQLEIDSKREEVRKIDERRTTVMGRNAELKRLADAETNRDKAKSEAVAAKKACDKLREIQAEIVEETFVPLLQTANRIFGSILATPIAYNAEKAEIGTWRAGVWVGHRTFSGTEKLLTYAAIQAALASSCKIRLMILDELGRIDGVNFNKVCSQISGAVKDGLLDQFVGIDTEDRLKLQVCPVFDQNSLHVITVK